MSNSIDLLSADVDEGTFNLQLFFFSVHKYVNIFCTGFTDELAFPGSVGICTPIPTVTTFSIKHLCCVGMRHGGVQDVLPAQSHQTS